MNSVQHPGAEVSHGAILAARHLTKIFRGRPPVAAVNDVSFGLAEGEILGVLGSNGAGKTTIIRMLLSLLTPSSGEITILGKDLAKRRSEILQHVGFASTYTNLHLFLSVEENLDIHGRLCGLPGPERKRRIREALEVFGLTELRKRRITQLSAGQRTRVMLLKAFLSEPRIALLDEPTASLDPQVANQVRKYICDKRRQAGTSIIFTSRNMNEVSKMCDRVIFLAAGRITAVNTPQALASQMGGGRLALHQHVDARRFLFELHRVS